MNNKILIGLLILIMVFSVGCSDSQGETLQKETTENNSDSEQVVITEDPIEVSDNIEEIKEKELITDADTSVNGIGFKLQSDAYSEIDNLVVLLSLPTKQFLDFFEIPEPYLAGPELEGDERTEFFVGVFEKNKYIVEEDFLDFSEELQEQYTDEYFNEELQLIHWPIKEYVTDYIYFVEENIVFYHEMENTKQDLDKAESEYMDTIHKAVNDELEKIDSGDYTDEEYANLESDLYFEMHNKYEMEFVDINKNDYDTLSLVEFMDQTPDGLFLNLVLDTGEQISYGTPLEELRDILGEEYDYRKDYWNSTWMNTEVMYLVEGYEGDYYSKGDKYNSILLVFNINKDTEVVESIGIRLHKEE